MYIIIYTPSSPGLINHSIALANLLIVGGHRVSIVSGPEAKSHFKFVNHENLFIECDSHSLQFGSARTKNLTHIEQICEESFLHGAVKKEIELIKNLKPDLIITKNFISARISAAATQTPWASYFTGGPIHLFKHLNPLSQSPFKNLGNQVCSVARDFGVHLEPKLLSDLQLSPYLNLVRGIPELAYLSKTEIAHLPSNAYFMGALTFDGSEHIKPIEYQWFKSTKVKVFITLGTATHISEPYNQILESIAKLTNISTLIATHPHYVAREDYCNVEISGYIPNSIALAHADIVIHHGGYGTLLESITHAVPQIIVAQNRISSCQQQQGRIIEKLALGTKLERDELTPSRIQSAIDLVQNRSIKNMVVKRQAQLKDATRKLQSAFLNTLKSDNWNHNGE